jgi:hypothetical protein
LGNVQSSASQLKFAFLVQSHIFWLDQLEFSFEEKKGISGLVSDSFIHSSHVSILHTILKPVGKVIHHLPWKSIQISVVPLKNLHFDELPSL